jgi:hypothetical protein
MKTQRTAIFMVDFVDKICYIWFVSKKQRPQVIATPPTF